MEELKLSAVEEAAEAVVTLEDRLLVLRLSLGKLRAAFYRAFAPIAQHILPALTAEARRLGYDERAQRQLHMIYLDMLRRAAADRYRCAAGFGGFRRAYAAFHRRHREFQRTCFPQADTAGYSRGMRLFAALAERKCSLPMYLYLAAREREVAKAMKEGNV